MSGGGAVGQAVVRVMNDSYTARPATTRIPDLT